MTTVNIKELDLNMIPPSLENYMYKPDDPKFVGGSKIVVIGKPGTGKSTLISSILYSKKHLIPIGVVMSGTEDSNGHYKKIFPSSFVYNEYSEPVIKKVISRQKLAIKNLENPWSTLIIDDCAEDPKIFRRPLQTSMYKNGRHWMYWYILSLQYCMDIPPAIRNNTDGIFILREPTLPNRKKIWENYASIIPDFDIFCQLMDQMTTDYCSMYIHNRSQSNNWKDCVFWYKATPPPPDFKFGSPSFWEFHFERYNDEYVDPVKV